MLRERSTTSMQEDALSVIDRSTQDVPETSRPETSTDWLRLLRYNELEEWQKDNEFIHGWYRAPLYSFKNCFRSCFRWHNETINIWTHFLPSVFFAVFLVTHSSMSSESFVNQLEEKQIIGLFVFSAWLCLFLSALFHTLIAHSKKIASIYSRLDFCGITLLIMGSFIPWIYYNFYCMPQSQLSYISCLSILGLFTMVFTQWKRFSTPEYRVVRACLFIALAMSSMIPIFHACGRVGIANAWEECQLKWIVIMAFSYLFGTYLYATQTPEVKIPGKFDLIGCSHNIFHVFVVGGVMSHLVGVTNLRDLRQAIGSNCTDENIF